MKAEEIFSQVSVANIFKYILELHHHRDPIQNYEELTRAGEYIEEKFASFGLATERNKFKVNYLDNEYFNVIGTLNPGNSEEILITAHYDHIRNVIGADDNLSGVAIMLECARVLADSGFDKTVKFVSFTLEEQHPGLNKLFIDARIKHGLYSKDLLDTHYSYFKNRVKFAQTISGFHIAGKSKIDAFQETFNKIRPELSENEIKYYKEVEQIYLNIDKDMEFIGLQGSQQYVKDYKHALPNIRGVINLETCGYTSRKQYSQEKAPGLEFEHFPTHNVHDYYKGDYIFIVADKNSTAIGNQWFTSCAHSEINLPAMLVAVPLGFEDIRKNAPDILRSDHSPFWVQNVPALMITDGANFRNPFYHTSADTIETLDFEFMTKIGKTTVLTVLNTLN
jgi:hypothetical protein